MWRRGRAVRLSVLVKFVKDKARNMRYLHWNKETCEVEEAGPRVVGTLVKTHDRINTRSRAIITAESDNARQNLIRDMPIESEIRRCVETLKTIGSNENFLKGMDSTDQYLKKTLLEAISVRQGELQGREPRFQFSEGSYERERTREQGRRKREICATVRKDRC